MQADAYYYDAVLWAVEKGVTSGTSATTFSPDATVTRGQTVTFLYRNAGSPEVSGTMPFTDVEADAYYAKAVQWAVQQKITDGTSFTTFSSALRDRIVIAKSSRRLPKFGSRLLDFFQRGGSDHWFCRYRASMAATCARWALSLGAMVLLPTPFTMPF